MEFLFGIAMIVGVAKVGEMLVEMARSRSNMGATQEVRALYHEVHALRQEMAQMRADEQERHPLLAAQSYSSVGGASASPRWYANGTTASAATTRRAPAQPSRIEEEFVMPRPQTQPLSAAVPQHASAAAPATAEVSSRIEQLQQEMNSLRDTTTQFDLSFDSAVDRLERRLQEMERQDNSSSPTQQVIGRAR